MDRIYPSTNCPDPTNSTLILQMRQDKATGLMIAPSMAGTTLVPKPFGNASGLPSTFASIPVNNFPSFQSGRSSSTVENPSVGGLADFKARLQAAGLPEEVCQVLMASS